jgi:hypothetical protein
MLPEPCGDGVLAHLADDPVPHPDLLGQISDRDIVRLETVTTTEEYL